MSVELSSHFRGVLCRHCGKPVRVPKIVQRKDSENQGHRASEDSQFQLISRVFVLRCRSCERESIYAIDQIVDCAFGQAPDSGRLAQTVAH
jgi:RNase P subunit RPR2